MRVHQNQTRKVRASPLLRRGGWSCRHVALWHVALLAVCLSPVLSHADEQGGEHVGKPVDEPDANVLQARAKVAGMAEESLDLIKSDVALTGVEGWAVFSGDRLSPSLHRGVGMAEDFNGETYFLKAGVDGCLLHDYRHVLVFRDREVFESFRKGELQGEALERLRSRSSRGELVAFQFRPAQQPQLETLDLSGCRFALHKDLQRALVAEPSRTEGLVEDDHVDVDDN